jgi:hypothetical protein
MLLVSVDLIIDDTPMLIYNVVGFCGSDNWWHTHAYLASPGTVPWKPTQTICKIGKWEWVRE